MQKRNLGRKFYFKYNGVYYITKPESDCKMCDLHPETCKEIIDCVYGHVKVIKKGVKE